MWQNIPYYTENDLDYKKSNVGVDVIGSLVRNLDTARTLLGETPRNGDVGRATKWTALAYTGRVNASAAAKKPVYGDAAQPALREVRHSNHYALDTSFEPERTGLTTVQ